LAKKKLVPQPITNVILIQVNKCLHGGAGKAVTERERAVIDPTVNAKDQNVNEDFVHHKRVVVGVKSFV
jgi:hypothetical protein